jgi:hypothetical protein
MSLERLASWALAAAVVVVAGLAAVDAVRQRGSSAQPAETEAELPDRERLVERLRGAGVTGRLLVAAPGECSRAVWSLPELLRRGTDTAACVGSGAPAGGRAFRPDGSETAVDRRGIVLVLPGCGPDDLGCRRPLVPRAELERAVRGHPSIPPRPPRLRVLVDEVAWLTDSHAAVLLNLRLVARSVDLPSRQTIAFFEGPRLVAARHFLRGDLARLAASPDGRHVAVLPGLVLRADGSELPVPARLVPARALAWSPDGRRLALSRPGAVALVPVESLTRAARADAAPAGAIDLPLEAAALEWR